MPDLPEGRFLRSLARPGRRGPVGNVQYPDPQIRDPERELERVRSERTPEVILPELKDAVVAAARAEEKSRACTKRAAELHTELVEAINRHAGVTTDAPHE